MCRLFYLISILLLSSCLNNNELTYVTNISEIFRNIVLGIAAMVGGIWGFIKFFELNQKKGAVLEQEKIKLDNEIKELQLKVQPVLNFQLEVSQVRNNTEAIIIKTIVEISNVGTKNGYLEFSNTPFSVTRIYIANNGNMIFDKTSYYDIVIPGDTKRITTSLVLRKGMSKDFVFLTRVEKSGYYLVRFEVPLSVEDIKNLDENSQNNDNSPVWSKSEIIELK